MTAGDIDLNRSADLAQQLRGRNETEAADHIDRLELQCFRLKSQVTMLCSLLEKYVKGRNRQ